MTHGWILVQTKAGQSAAFLKMVAGQERLYPGIISPAQQGKYVWAWLVNEGNWARRLGYYTVGFSHPGSVGKRVWAKAHGTHNASFFPVGREVFPGWQKKTFVTSLVWGTVYY